jgi:hypothetical protein
MPTIWLPWAWSIVLRLAAVARVVRADAAAHPEGHTRDRAERKGREYGRHRDLRSAGLAGAREAADDDDSGARGSCGG